MQEKFVFAKDFSAKGRFQGFLARFRTSWVLNSRTDKGTCGRRITVIYICAPLDSAVGGV